MGMRPQGSNKAMAKSPPANNGWSSIKGLAEDPDTFTIKRTARQGTLDAALRATELLTSKKTIKGSQPGRIVLRCGLDATNKLVSISEIVLRNLRKMFEEAGLEVEEPQPVSLWGGQDPPPVRAREDKWVLQRHTRMEGLLDPMALLMKPDIDRRKELALVTELVLHPPSDPIKRKNAKIGKCPRPEPSAYTHSAAARRPSNWSVSSSASCATQHTSLQAADQPDGVPDWCRLRRPAAASAATNVTAGNNEFGDLRCATH